MDLLLREASICWSVNTASNKERKKTGSTESSYLIGNPSKCTNVQRLQKIRIKIALSIVCTGKKFYWLSRRKEKLKKKKKGWQTFNSDLDIRLIRTQRNLQNCIYLLLQFPTKPHVSVTISVVVGAGVFSFYSQAPPLGHWWAIPIIDGDVTPMLWCFRKRHVYDDTSSHPPVLPLLYSTPHLRPLVIKLSSNWYNIWMFRKSMCFQ